MKELNPEIQELLTKLTIQLIPIIVAETIIPLSDKFIFLDSDLKAFLSGPVNEWLWTDDKEVVHDIVQHFFDAELYHEVTDARGVPTVFLHTDEIYQNGHFYELQFPAMARIFRLIIENNNYQEILANVKRIMGIN